MGKKVRISDESVNSYGTRIITSGIDFAQYNKNPVLLYMHNRGNGVVGLVKNLEVKDGELLGELEFDCATELSQRLKKQYEFGSMRMVSGNFQILETSDDKELVAEGQTAQTIVRCKLFEVSAVDIGGNDNAIVLSSPDGKTISLARGEEDTFLPLLNNASNNPLKKNEKMDLKTIALQVGLAETATESEVTAKIEALKLAHGKVAALEAKVKEMKTKQEQMQLAAIEAAVDDAIGEKRLTAGMKNHFVDLGKKVGIDALKMTLGAMQPQGKISTLLHRTSTGQVVEKGDDYSKYEKLSAVPGNLWADLKSNHPGDYARLYKAEYGIDLDSVL